MALVSASTTMSLCSSILTGGGSGYPTTPKPKRPKRDKRWWQWWR